MVEKIKIIQCHLQTEVGVEVEDELGNDDGKLVLLLVKLSITRL